MKLLRILRGALGTACTWAVAWGVAGFGLFALMFSGPNLEGFASAWPFLTGLSAASGFVGGLTFSVVLRTLYRRVTISELSPSRMALWGALAGAIVPAGYLAGLAFGGAIVEGGVVVPLLVALSGLGAATAAGTVQLAQAASPRIEAPERDLLEG